MHLPPKIRGTRCLPYRPTHPYPCPCKALMHVSLTRIQPKQTTWVGITSMALPRRQEKKIIIIICMLSTSTHHPAPNMLLT